MPTYIRCRDTVTGHEYDVDFRSLAVFAGALEPISNYPPNSGPGAKPRPAKHYVAKDGRPAIRRRRTSQPTRIEGEPQ